MTDVTVYGFPISTFVNIEPAADLPVGHKSRLPLDDSRQDGLSLRNPSSLQMQLMDIVSAFAR